MNGVKEKKMDSKIIVAVDTSDLETASSWIAALNGYVGLFKLGLEFFMKNGAAGVRELVSRHNFNLFLDLKLHDIPNTVQGAVESVSDINPRFLTVHASGGREMISRAAAVNPAISITGVTILTSLDHSDLTEIGYAGTPLDSAVKLAQLASASGARAIVSSPLEVSHIRQAVSDDIILITPGVRPASGKQSDDQKRVMTPGEAVKSGANYLVIGRPITAEFAHSTTQAVDAAKRINEEIGVVAEK
jgi:orotidine-5'-phosphate decarboxylase